MPIERPLEQGRNEAEVGSAAPEVSSRSISGQYPDMHPDTASAAATGIALRRHFVPAGVNPYDEVEWERAQRRHPGRERRDRLRAARRRDAEARGRSSRPTSSSRSTSAGTLGTPQRERSVRQLIGRVVDHDRRVGRRAGLLRHAGRRRHVRRRADAPAAPAEGARSTARCGSTSASSRSRSARRASSSRSTTRWSRSSTGTARRASSSRAARARA